MEMYHLLVSLQILRDSVACGSVVRLQHLQTRLFLHSHKFSAPLSGNQEVSCFGDGTVGDSGILQLLRVVCTQGFEVFLQLAGT